MGFGTCCIVQHTCDAVPVAQKFFFTNPSFPAADAGINGGSCSLSLEPCQHKICQIRLDFMDVVLVGPDAISGECTVDSLVVTGNGANHAKIPTLCGDLTGQHMYITVEPTCSPTKIHVDMNKASSDQRRFNIKITQIPCNSDSLAPSGCLQYHNATSGTVRSFNTGVGGGGHLIAGQNYATCVAALPGYCSISWIPKRPIDMPASCRH